MKDFEIIFEIIYKYFLSKWIILYVYQTCLSKLLFKFFNINCLIK